MKATPVEINWHSGLSIYAKESFLKAVGDEYGWLGGFDESGKLRCILPYTIVRKAIFRMVRFRVETIYLDGELTIEEEKAFLNSVVDYFRSTGADMIIPATTNTIFRAYPDGADAAPYGSYIIDLTKPEDVLWKNIDRIYRQNINTAIKAGVTVRDGAEHIEPTYIHVRDTFKKSKLPFMDYESFKRFVQGLGDNGKILIADYQGVVQSYVVFASSDYCAYAIYAGNLADLHQGANKLLYWDAIKYFKNLGIQRYDFVGARINPEKGSKQEGLNRLKKRYGANLKQGYMWKYSIHPLKYRLYCLAAQYRSGGDIVDEERHKLKDYSPA
jgi:lipid II:glycine glycyltransferase (peptidoglycan interpeptide bridge formation enzyme)